MSITVFTQIVEGATAAVASDLSADWAAEYEQQVSLLPCPRPRTPWPHGPRLAPCHLLLTHMQSTGEWAEAYARTMADAAGARAASPDAALDSAWSDAGGLPRAPPGAMEAVDAAVVTGRAAYQCEPDNPFVGTGMTLPELLEGGTASRMEGAYV